MKKISILPFLTLTALASVTGISGAHAQLITEVDSQAAFLAATTGNSVNDLESLSITQTPNNGGFYQIYNAAPATTTPFNPGPVLTNGNLTFTLTDLEQNKAFYAVTASGFGNSDGTQYIATGDGVEITGLGTNAVGFDIFTPGSTTPITGTVSVTDNLGNTYTNSLLAVPGNNTNTLAGNGFVGFLDLNPGATIVSIDITNAAIDNINVGTLAETPEPSTYAMLLGGLSALVFFRRMSRNSRNAGNC